MKSFNRHSLAILPLLSILSMSPTVMMESHTHRGIASIVEEQTVEPEKKEEFKKFKEYSAKVDPKTIIRNDDLTIDDLKKQESDLKIKLSEIKINEEKSDLKTEAVAEERKIREALVVDLLFLEDGILGLREGEKIELSDKEALEKSIVEHKTKIEELLNDLEKSEEILAQAENPKSEEPKLAEEDKEEEPKIATEEPKKEEPKVAVEEPKKEEVKKDICEADEKNALLTKQIEQLLADQKQIMQTMLGMAQMMVSMHQQSQQQPQQGIYHNPYVNPYQYHQPQTAGNWVYYPQGFQPQQPNIFAQPQIMQPQQQQGGFYPAQAHQQSQWNLAPQYNFQADPRYTVQPITPGNFGVDAFSYNLSNHSPSNPIPPMMGNPVANTGYQMPMNMF